MLYPKLVWIPSCLKDSQEEADSARSSETQTSQEKPSACDKRTFQLSCGQVQLQALSTDGSSASEASSLRTRCQNGKTNLKIKNDKHKLITLTSVNMENCSLKRPIFDNFRDGERRRLLDQP